MIMDINMLTFSYPNVIFFMMGYIPSIFIYIYDIYIYMIYIYDISIYMIIIMIIIYRDMNGIFPNILVETSNEMVEELMRVEVAEFHQ